MTYQHKKNPGNPRRPNNSHKRPSLGHKVRKLEIDNKALLEAFDLLYAEVETLRLRLARHLTEADLNILAEM